MFSRFCRRSHTYETDRPPQEGVETASAGVDASLSSAEFQTGLQAVDCSFHQHNLGHKTNPPQLPEAGQADPAHFLQTTKHEILVYAQVEMYR